MDILIRLRFFFLVILIAGCSETELPSYWRCEGDTSQVLLSDKGQELEKYSGPTSLLLESFRGTVTQYISVPFTGVYQTCIDNTDSLTFSLGSCESLPVYRKGSLDKHSGKLLLSEIQLNSRGKIVNQGQFQCEYLGHVYPSDVFYGPKK